MADLKYYDILLKPLMTEKSMKLMEEQRYTFYVHPEANKAQIKEAIERLFTGTKVHKVNTMNCHPKKRHRRGSQPGRTAKRKKAIVILAPGSKEIEIFQGM